LAESHLGAAALMKAQHLAILAHPVGNMPHAATAATTAAADNCYMKLPGKLVTVQLL
jgi:hypothetical protein